MKKPNQSKPMTIASKMKSDNPQSQTPTPTPEGTSRPIDVKGETMDVEEDKKNNIDLDEELKAADDVHVDLTEKKPKTHKKPYDLDDAIIKDITLSSDVHIRLLSNINGYFVDIRKFFRGYPSQKGIRMNAPKFVIAADILKQDIEKLGLPCSLRPNYQSTTP